MKQQAICDSPKHQCLGELFDKSVISNVERVIKKSMEDAEKKGMEKGMERVARQMLSEGQAIEKIMKYTGLTSEEIEKLQ